MNAWTNIDISSDDPEIIAINQMEILPGDIPEQILKVRELITRFEVCHFKYQRHYEYIMKSIAALKPMIEIDHIGLTHPRYNGNAWIAEPTGRSRVGQMYISALRWWLQEDSFNHAESPGQEALELSKRVNVWLGDRIEKKEKLIHMLLSRLLWKSAEPYRSGGELSELEYQTEATDICSYAFPQNLDKLIQAIGKLEPVKEFDGCGTFNAKIHAFLSKEFEKLCVWLTSDTPCDDLGLGEKEPMRIWLVACLAKTIKTDLHRVDPISGLIP